MSSASGAESDRRPTASVGKPSSTMRFMTLAWLYGVPSNSSRRSACASNCTTPMPPWTARAARAGASDRLCSRDRTTKNVHSATWGGALERLVVERHRLRGADGRRRAGDGALAVGGGALERHRQHHRAAPLVVAERPFEEAEVGGLRGHRAN